MLEQQYDSAKAWVDLMDRLAGETHLWDTGFQLGDWLDPAAPPEDPADALPDKYLVATAYFAGTPAISDALSETGHHDAAYALLLEEENPSWLYTVKQGGTTIWERWDSQRPDGSVNPGEMTSFNHYGLGSVADWLH